MTLLSSSRGCTEDAFVLRVIGVLIVSGCIIVAISGCAVSIPAFKGEVSLETKEQEVSPPNGG